MPSSSLLAFCRIWLPAVICLAGLGVIVARGGDETSLEGGAAIIGAGLSVALLNWLYRVGVSGDRERRTEDEARDYFEKYGRWPDEDPARQPPSRST
jgi:hypothetical protein